MRRDPVYVLFVDHVPLHAKEAVTAYVDAAAAQRAAQCYCDDQRAAAGLRPFALDWRDDGGGRQVADDVALEADFLVYLLEVGS